MKPIAGINRDVALNDQLPGTYRHAQNILLTKLNRAVATEPGTTTEYAKAGYVLVGTIPVRDEAVVLFYVESDYLTDTSYLSEIVYLDQEGTATLIVQHADLAFNPSHPFKGVYYYNTKDELVIAWTDNNNPPRILNIDAPEFTGTTPDAKFIKRLSIFPNAETPSIEGVVDLNSSGSIDNGAYTFFVTYEIDNEIATNYLGGSGSFLVGDDGDIDGQSAVGIKLNINNLDVTYDYFRLYVVKTAGSTKTGHYIRRMKVPSSGAINLTWTGTIISGASYEDIIINNASYTKSKSLTVLNDRLYLANLSADTFFDYQPYANAITAKWTYRDSFHSTSSKKTPIAPEEYGSFRGFMPGATYAFYIAFVLKDGTYSAAFNIPGREPTVSEGTAIFNEFAAKAPLRESDINDYSSTDLDGNNLGEVYTESNDPHASADYNYYSGTMGLHRNDTETYPDTDSWAIKNVVGSVNTNDTLRGEKVRHHKFPSIQKLAATIGNFNKRDVLFGIKFDNILLPTEVKEKAVGYTIFYAARDFGNMDVLTYLPIIGNNFQDGDNPTTTPATPGCTITTTGDCGVFEVSNLDFQDTAQVVYNNCAGVEITQSLYPGQFTVINADIPTGTTPGNEEDAFSSITGDVRIDYLSTFTGSWANTTSGTECASQPLTTALRIYDPMILSKKPAVSSAFVVPEWYKNLPWKSTSNDLLSNQTSWASAVADIEYVPANNAAAQNYEREEAALLSATGITAGEWKGRASGTNGIAGGIGGKIGNYIIIGSLRQFVPDLYTPYSNQTLASTSRVYDITNLSGGLISQITGGHKATTPPLYGGDTTLELARFEYMTAEENNNDYDSNTGTGMYDESNDKVENLSSQGYTYFKENSTHKSVRRAQYVTPTRLPISKIYADPGLQPNLSSFAIPSYGGEYLNQYLINPAYETINTTKPAFTFNDLNAEFVETFSTRIARSVVQQSESTNLQWRTFRSSDYYEHLRTKGSITNIEEHNNELLIHHEQALFKTIGKEQLSATATEVFLGTGDIFNFPPRELVDTPLGYAGNQHLAASSLTKVGYFFLDLEQRKIFLVSAGLKEISSMGMRNWFRDNMDFALKAQLESKGVTDKYTLFDAPAHTHGCGFTSAFDEEYNRYILSKKSWKFSATGLAKVALGSTYETKVDGKIYFINGIPFTATIIGENDPTYTLLDMSGNDVEVDSWTVSYSPATESWVSFHDYKPSLLFNTRNKLFSFTGTTVHTHNTGAVGNFYGTAYPAIIDLVFNPAATQSKVFFNFNWITESFNTSGGSVKKDTFTHATVYNSYQLSSRVTLTNHTNTTGTLRETEGTWFFNTFRDKLNTQNTDFVSEDGTIDYTVLDTSKPWYQQRRFIDKYAVVRLEYDNSSGNTLYLYEASAAIRVSKR